MCGGVQGANKANGGNASGNGQEDTNKSAFGGGGGGSGGGSGLGVGGSGGGKGGIGSNQGLSGGGSSVDGSKASVGGDGASKTVDIDGDGKADVTIQGQNADKLADLVAKEAKSNPKFAGMIKEAAKANPNGVAEIDATQDLGGGVAGKAQLGQAGEGNMEVGKIKVDKEWMGRGDKDALDTIVHEFGHNAGYQDDTAAHKNYISNILNSGTAAA